MGLKTTYAQLKEGEAPTNTNKFLLEAANKALTTLTEEVEEEIEESTDEQKMSPRIKTRKEKIELKDRISLENKLEEQTKGTCNYMVWEGKLEQHKYACLTEEQRNTLEGENKRLRILTPATKKREKFLRQKQIEKLKMLREKLGITDNPEKSQSEKTGVQRHDDRQA